MNEASGSTVTDTSGHAFNGAYGSNVALGNASLVAGDAAPTFPGGTATTATVARSSSNAALAPTGAFSAEFWVNVPSTVTGSQFLWTQSFASGAGSYPAYISLESGAPPFFTVQINTAGGLVSAYPAAVLGAKNHVVATWNGTTLTAYVNGVAKDTATGSGALQNYSSPYAGFTLGGPGPGHPGLSGALGEFALYGSALSAARVTAHYNAAINPDPTPPPSNYATTVLADSPVVYYRTNEASGTTAVDSSSHGYTGSFGSSVALGGASLVPGDSAPTFPGGTATAATVLRSSTNAALAPTGAFSTEFWVNVPSTVTGSQFLWTQSFASGAGSYPAYISLESGAPPFFTVQINTAGGLVSAYPAAVLGAKNHVVATWNGTTLTAYVNGVAKDTATGSGALQNYSSPYAGFTLGGPGPGHPGFSGSLGEFALYATALPAARVTAHYNAGTSSSAGTLVWQTGSGSTTGQYVLPAASDGQCAGVGPVISGNNATFTLLRNTSTSYTYNNNTFPGASTCYRNQMNPVDSSTGTNLLLAMGGQYTFTFQTVVTLNGNTAYRDDLPNGHLGVDIPAIVWQTHSYGGSGSPCDTLVIGNTYAAYVNGITLYGTPAPGGLATWQFHTCDDNSYASPSYNSPDTLVDGEVDNWQIDVTAQIQGQTGGSVVVRRNGSIVYNAPTHVCDGSTTQCFWNFGPYFFYFNSSEEPPGWNDAGVTVTVNNMKLVKNN